MTPSSSFLINYEEDRKKFSNMKRRSLSLLIDIITLMPFILFNYYNSLFGKNIFYHFLSILCMFALKVVMELKYQQTVGKMICKILIVDKEQKPANKSLIWKRNIIPLLSFILTFIHSYLMFGRENTQFLNYTINLEAIIGLSIVAIHFSFAVSYFCGAMTPKFQTLHDLFAGSYCLNKENNKN